MPHILINGDNAPLCPKSLAKNEVKFTEFNEKCDDCGLALDESACIDDNSVKCGGCGKKYPIIETTKSGDPGEKEKPVKTEPKKAAKTEKIVKATKPVVEKKVVKPTVEKKAKPALKPVAAEKKERKSRDGSVSQTSLVATDKCAVREGSCAELILKAFKKAAIPAKVVDKLIDAWKSNHEASETFKKNPKGYVMWYVLDLLRKGGLKKA
jgi:hypothetical protein